MRGKVGGPQHAHPFAVDFAGMSMAVSTAQSSEREGCQDQVKNRQALWLEFQSFRCGQLCLADL